MKLFSPLLQPNILYNFMFIAVSQSEDNRFSYHNLSKAIRITKETDLLLIHRHILNSMNILNMKYGLDISNYMIINYKIWLTNISTHQQIQANKHLDSISN